MAEPSTQCPHCLTVFRVTEQQLELVDGLVRCGACRQVFAATEHWVNEVQPSSLDGLAGTEISQAYINDILETDAQSTEQDQPKVAPVSDLLQMAPELDLPEADPEAEPQETMPAVDLPEMTPESEPPEATPESELAEMALESDIVAPPELTPEQAIINWQVDDFDAPYSLYFPTGGEHLSNLWPVLVQIDPKDDSNDVRAETDEVALGDPDVTVFTGPAVDFDVTQIATEHSEYVPTDTTFVSEFDPEPQSIPILK